MDQSMIPPRWDIVWRGMLIDFGLFVRLKEPPGFPARRRFMISLRFFVFVTVFPVTKAE